MDGKDKNLFGNLPSCAADYIRDVIKKMRWQKKVRGDVQAELIGHFEDALKDCKNDMEREKTAKELISDFGNAKVIATLARRAKKRCRPLWQKTLIRTFQTIGIIIVLFVLYVSWFISGRPKITVNYTAELNRIVRPSDANDSQNAAFYYIEAAEKIKTLPENLKNLFAKSYFECNEPEKRQGQDWLAKNQDVLNLVIAGSDKPYCWDKYESKNNNVMMLSVLLPHLSPYKTLSKILCWNANLLAEEGNYRQGFENILTMLKLGKHIKTEPVIIEQFVGISIENTSVQNLRQILSRYNIDKSELAKLQGNLEAIAQEDIFRINFKAERLCMYDAIQRWCTDDIFGGHVCINLKGFVKEMIGGANGTQEQGFLVSSKSLFRALFIEPGKKGTLKALDEICDYYEKLSALTPYEQRSMETNMHKKLQELTNNTLSAILAPAFDKTVTMPYRNKAEIVGTTTIIAAIRYKQENGAYPDNLKELLSAGLVKEIPLDPFSDKPLVYKKTEKDFTLYSVGPDFVDNGGKVEFDKDGKPKMWNAESGNAVFWPVVNPGQKTVTTGR